MRTTPFKTVFDKVVRLHGRDPRQPISSDLANVDHINDRVATICQGWLWPEWVVTEERAFRPVWGSTEQYLKASLTDGLPDEVFYLGAAYVANGDFGTGYGYYRVKSGAMIDPPVGTVPTNATYWEVLDPVDSFIAYDQRDRRAIGMVLDVFGANPRVPTGSNSGRRKFMPSERGIDVPGGGTTVFITQKMPVPAYTMTPYVVGKTYARADVVFDPSTGNCFQAVRSTSIAPVDVTTTDDWNLVPFLAVWQDYVTKGAFADSLMEFDQGGNGELQAKMVLNQYWNQQADDALQQEVDALTVQGQRLTWNFCRDHTYSREVEQCALVRITDV
jgi:hypothetical protein